MPRVVGIIGFKNSGKTTLARKLARELIRRGHKVAVVKHLSHHLDLPGKDTTILGEEAGQVGFVSPQGSGVFWKKQSSLEDIIPYLEADIVLVEGFKAEKTYPKVVCLRGEPDDADPRRSGELFDGLAICAVGPADQVGELDVPSFDRLRIPLLDRDDVGRVADLVEQKAFKLPNLDCGGCGHERCYDLAREIVAGSRSVEDCVSLHPATEVSVDGQPIPLNPFISRIVRGTILGMLSSFKGFKKGKVEIRF
ncbi:MAG TPA: molybdopterin-guanine dinucleotide biosynthesis protein B [Anaerolineae bacterium]|nr:molybdopterin-guanine dinucleotide biosynthesis protein B [Anaerolineae bacterium]